MKRQRPPVGSTGATSYQAAVLDAVGVGLMTASVSGEPRLLAARLAGLVASARKVGGSWLALRDGSLAGWDPAGLQGLLDRPVDIWHGGLRLGAAGQPSLLRFVRPAWMLGADADAGIESTSWRLSPRSLLVRLSVWERLGGFWPEFGSLEAMVLDLGLRALEAGVVLRYSPLLAPAGETPPFSLPPADEVRLMVRLSGRRWGMWALWRAWRSGHWGMAHCLRGATGLATLPPRPALTGASTVSPESAVVGGQPQRVSVLIPTVDRYRYLATLLGQLEKQTIPPHQVIVVDQTEAARRRSDLAGQFPALNLQWLTLEKAGQCSSRNQGLRHATGDWVLFVDDDVEVPPDFIARHLANAIAFAADASCGTVVEPPFLNSSPQPKFPALSSVFPTCTSLLRRETLGRSGGFDLAYDHGQRADGDLGMRLYLTGALMILDPRNCILHHHAPRGGLRAHGARVVRRIDRRRGAWPRVQLSPWDLYRAHRYFGREAMEEVARIATVSAATCEGNWLIKGVRAGLAFVLWPWLLRQVRAVQRRAEELIVRGPEIPSVMPAGEAPASGAPFSPGVKGGVEA